MLVPRRAGGITRLLSYISLALMGSLPVHAVCIPAPDSHIRQLQDLITTDPNRAIARADQLLLASTASPASQNAAWLHAVRAQAYSALELDLKARAASAQGLRLVPDQREPVHVALAIVDAENVYDSEGIAGAINTLQKLRAVAGANLEMCLLISLGTLHYRHGDADLAIPTLVQAHAAAAGKEEQRVAAADALSSVLRDIGDYKQALVLNGEVVEWYRERQASLALSVALYLRGNILQEMKDSAAAVRAFEESRVLSLTIEDTQGVAFSDMRICDVQADLGDRAAARKSCNSALAAFVESQATDVEKQTRLTLARLDLESGESARALSTLNAILAEGEAELPPRIVGPLFALRAKAHAARGNFSAAYADLDNYSKRYVAANEIRRIRQIAGMRARFETDREIERNSALRHELEISQQRQTQLQRRTWFAVAASLLVIALLTAMLIGARRHRRQLSDLAAMDVLTSLPNRRRTAELASLAIAEAESTSQPLTLALIDLDHFKSINDQHGHAVGDQVLRDFSRLSREMLRETDTFGRWGGEEFLLLMPGTTLDLALAIVERLRSRATEIAVPGAKQGLNISLSAGLASTGPSPTTIDELLALADAALYRAKHEGRNRVRIDASSVESASSGVRRAIAPRAAAQSPGS
jgi:diguanylate cyclase (GGDEF)-like protein